MKTLLICGLILFALFGANAQEKNERNYVPNEETAIKIAEAIWLPIYGKSIYKKRPFVAKLIDNNIWEVTGTLAANLKGGVPIIKIQKSDCKILYVMHGK